MNRVIIHYNNKLVDRAREMRNNPTPSEHALWQRLKGKRVRGFDFHRQKPAANYIIDFYCSELFLAIEVDGGIHQFQEEQDYKRQECLETFGLSFLRFTDKEVLHDVENVISTIERWIDDNAWSIIGVDDVRP